MTTNKIIGHIIGNMIGHIIGIDETHKSNLISRLPNHIKIIDLDEIQQFVHNNPELVGAKQRWNNINSELGIKRRQKNLLPFRELKNLSKSIDDLTTQKTILNQEIHQLWKKLMDDEIMSQLQKLGTLNNKINGPTEIRILFVGYNLFPKDYRIKINLPIPTFGINFRGKQYSNQIIFDTESKNFAANQIKYYLRQYKNKIINGNFPLNLLNSEYLANKYDKLISHYDKQGYQLVEKDLVRDIIVELDKQFTVRGRSITEPTDVDTIIWSVDFNPTVDQPTNQPINQPMNQPINQPMNQSTEPPTSTARLYVATIFRTPHLIPFSKNPLNGYRTKNEAINNIVVPSKSIVYLYEINANEFRLVDGKYIANGDLHPRSEEQIML